MSMSAAAADIDVKRLREALGSRSIVLVGLMGAGKSSIGRRLAHRLGLPFVDADTEIEKAADLTIPEIFEKHGEPYFRAGEVRVVARILDSGPQVLGHRRRRLHELPRRAPASASAASRSGSRPNSTC